MIAITVDASDVEEKLRIVGSRLDDMTEPLTKILTSALEDARAEIISQGSLFGGGWAEMSPLTPIITAKLYGRGRDPRTLLYDTGGLLDSLTPEGASNIFEVGPLEGEAGTSYSSPRTGFPIAARQQKGTSRSFKVLQGEGYSDRGIPAREFLAWHESRFDQYLGVFAEHIGVDV